MREIFSLIAVHGFAGGPRTTWQHPTTGLDLLKHLLPKDFPSLRVFSYGHDLRSSYTNVDKKQAERCLYRLAEQLVLDISDNIRKVYKIEAPPVTKRL